MPRTLPTAGATTTAAVHAARTGLHTMATASPSAAVPAATRPKGLSLHLGLNLVSPAAYGGWDGPLAACEFDANDMAAIAKSKGMKPTVLLTKKATRANLLAAMRRA
ncbi:MAG: hypothetical protein Q7T55_06665, partial [Solirubrobacteraceae bacterium]|nr:hypothetical protein [Solirubrobacteraceae bacterium]